MNDNVMQYMRVIGRVQSQIAKSNTLEEALQGGLKIILDNCGADYAVIWYQDSFQSDKLHPFYWIAPMDFTVKVHTAGEGIVGRVFTEQNSVRMLDYKAGRDPEVEEDFAGMDISSVVCVPFSNKYENLGCIEFVTDSGTGKLTEEEADICEILAMMAAIAIDDNEKIQVPWQEGKILLSARGITREFQNGDMVTKVLKGVNMDVYEGELLVVLGESGCGKSTFLNIIGGMDQATGGTFSYMGKDMSRASQEELTLYRRDNIGFIFQSYNLMPNLTAKQNLDLIGELVDDPMPSEDALEMVGLKERMNNYPSQLSGGQQQRVSIARALVKRPKMIFADEPTAALDYTTSIEVLSVMEKIVEQGTTLLMVTHNEEITRMAHRVVRMRNGKMYEVTVNRHRVPATDLVW